MKLSVRARRWARCVMVLLVIGSVPAVPGTASGFGTIDGAGQHREHERITRAALACAPGAGPGEDCFQPRSMDQLAGHGKSFGAVGAPDSDEISNPAAHCDGADYLGGGYPRTRDQATAQLWACVTHLRTRFHEAVESAGPLLDERKQIAAGEVRLDADCQILGVARESAKCAAIEALGRALHGVQDFYSHSNWADEADPGRPIGADNPPGLNRRGPSPVLDLRRAEITGVPDDLITGCYVLQDRVTGTGACTGRVTHAGLNKDNGIVDPVTGAAGQPGTPRGQAGQNFAKAVAGAIAETRRQWRDFRAELGVRYGRERAAAMICALTRDDPAGQCRRSRWGITPVLLAGGLAVLVAVAWHSRRRRRR